MFFVSIIVTIVLSNIKILSKLFCLFISSVSNWKTYLITDKTRIICISKHIISSTYLDEQNNHSGFFFGNGFVGLINVTRGQDNHVEKLLYLLINKKNLKNISQTHYERVNSCNELLEPISSKKKSQVTYWSRVGSYWSLNYQSRIINIALEASEKQQKVMNSMIEFYRKNERGVFFVYGEPGTGKSTLWRLLGQHYQSHICKKLKLTDPNDSIDLIYNQISPTKEKPLILLFDEVDTMIYDIHHSRILKHKHMPIEIHDKTSYNGFFDDINSDMYPYVIILLTSNKSKQDIDDTMHTCYLRKGRVDQHFIL